MKKFFLLIGAFALIGLVGCQQPAPQPQPNITVNTTPQAQPPVIVRPQSPPVIVAPPSQPGVIVVPQQPRPGINIEINRPHHHHPHCPSKGTSVGVGPDGVFIGVRR